MTVTCAAESITPIIVELLIITCTVALMYAFLPDRLDPTDLINAVFALMLVLTSEETLEHPASAS